MTFRQSLLLHRPFCYVTDLPNKDDWLYTFTSYFRRSWTEAYLTLELLSFTFLYYNIIHFISIVPQLRIEYVVDIAGRYMAMNIGTEKSIVFYNSYSTLTVQYKWWLTEWQEIESVGLYWISARSEDVKWVELHLPRKESPDTRLSHSYFDALLKPCSDNEISCECLLY